MSTFKLAMTLAEIRKAATASAPLFLKPDDTYALTIQGVGPEWKSGPTLATSIGAVSVAELCKETMAETVRNAIFVGSTEEFKVGTQLLVTISKGRITTVSVATPATAKKK